MVPFFLISVVVLALDLITKGVVRATMPVGAEIPVLPFFSLTHVENTGIAFGMFRDRNLILIAVAVVVTIFVIKYGLSLLKTDRPTAFAMAVIAGGASGNLCDRVLRGRVTDFFDVFIGVHHWPVFNIADSAICVGAAFVVLRGLYQGRTA